jgi:peptidoglycan/xylan/chitin deacetylase (PgdA/CDA1 family)
MPLLSPSGLVRDVRAAERAIVAATGVDPRPWFRCPFGAGTHDPAILAGLARLGYREIRWDVGGDDWHASRSGQGLARDLVAGAVERGDGAVVLLHPWTRATGLGLGRLIGGLRDAGASFVRVDALG